MKYETLKSYSLFFKISDRAVVVVIVWWLNLQLPMQVEHITTKVVRSNHGHGEINSIQHYVIKFASALWPVGDFLRVLRFQPQINPTATIVESGVKHHTLTQNLK